MGDGTRLRSLACSPPPGMRALPECPQCAYAFDSLPAAGVCPECGFAYEEQMILVRTVAMARYVPARMLALACFATAIAALWVIGGLRGVTLLLFGCLVFQTVVLVLEIFKPTGSGGRSVVLFASREIIQPRGWARHRHVLTGREVVDIAPRRRTGLLGGALPPRFSMEIAKSARAWLRTRMWLDEDERRARWLDDVIHARIQAVRAEP
jgi:hypothetical protein